MTEAPTPNERLIALFLEAIEPLNSREAERTTGVGRGAIDRMRKSSAPVHLRRNRGKVIDYLRSQGLLPPGLEVRAKTLTGLRGSRAEIAIQHFTSPAVARVLGWDVMDVVSALQAYAEEQKFDQAEMAKVRAWRDAYARGEK